MPDAMGRKDAPELEAAFNLLRQIYWREYGRGWRDVIAKIRNTVADTGVAEPHCPVCGGHHNIGNPCPGPQS